MSFELVRIDSAKIDSVMASDMARLDDEELGMYGVTPFIFLTTDSTFLSVYYQTNEDSGLSYGEQLFTARGT